MYEIISGISFLVRAYLCYLTIDNIPIFENHLLNSVFLESFSLYTLLWAVSRIITSFFYEKGTDSSYKGCFVYFIIYIINLIVLFGIMALLTFLKVLPL